MANQTKPKNPYIELIKPRIVLFQLFTVSMGFGLANQSHSQTGLTVLWLLLGTGLLSAGGAILNNVWEIDLDAKMERTQNRALPTNLISPWLGIAIGLFLTALGSYTLHLTTALSAFLGIFTVFLYVLIYTPSKRISWLNTLIGAVPGALPPLGGWAAATGSLSLGAWSLFAILFIWQLPHFFAINWLYAAEYRKAGFKMLMRTHDDSKKLATYTLFFTAFLLGTSLLPFYLGLLGPIYAAIALLSGVAFLKAAKVFFYEQNTLTAKSVLRASVFYIPLILIGILIDRLIGFTFT